MNLIEKCDKYTFNTYGRHKIVIDRAQNGYFIDKEGKKYIDFTSGIAVSSLGYDDEEFKNVLKSQIDKIIHCSNLYYNEPAALLAENLCANSDFEKAFFANTGTEANEGAIKLARLWAKKNKNENCVNFISFENSFHGRSTGALSLTGRIQYQKGFEPLIGEVRFAKYNDIESVKSLVDDTICAIFVEPIQGEGGVIEADETFLKELRALCSEKNIALIFDEVQTGIARCGKLFAYQNYGVVPDILTLAKGLGGGIPIGAILARNGFEDVMTPSTHGTTFGGNPLAMVAGNYVINKVSKKEFLDSVREKSEYFKSQFDGKLKGRGLLLGLEVDKTPSVYVSKALERGLLILSAGDNVLRFAPPLTISKERIDEGIKILKEIL